MFDHFLARQARRQAVVAAQRALADEVFGGDSRNIQCALEVFALSRAVHVRDFEGTLRGRGMRDTTVRTLAGGLTNGPPPFDVRPEMLVFEGGDVTISDFTFEAVGTVDWGSHHVPQDAIAALSIVGHHSEVDDPTEVLEISSRVERVRFLGEVGLADSDLKIGAVAREVGFSSVSQLNVMLRRAGAPVPAEIRGRSEQAVPEADA